MTAEQIKESDKNSEFERFLNAYEESLTEEEKKRYSSFKKAGGQILKFYVDGRPKEWKRGEEEYGKPKIDLPNIEEKIVFGDNDQYAGNPDDELKKELIRWTGIIPEEGRDFKFNK